MAETELARERRMVRVLAGIQFVNVLDFVLLLPLGPQLMRVFGISSGQFGLLVSVYMLAAAISGIVAGSLIDRYDRKRALLRLQGGFALALLACALAPDWIILLVARAAAGAFGGVIGTQVHAFIGDAVPPERRGRATGLVMSGFAVSSVVGVPFGLVLADLFGWRAPFAIAAFGVAVLFSIGVGVLPSRPARPGPLSHPLAAIGTVLKDANHRRAILLMSMLMAASFSIAPYSAPYLIHNVGLQEADLAVLYLFGGLITLFTSRWIGRAVDLHGKQRMFRIVTLLALPTFLVATLMPPVSLTMAVLLMMAYMSLGSGRFIPAMAIINAASNPALRGGFLSLSGAAQQASAGLASFVAGLVIGHGAGGELTRFGWIGVFAAVLTVVAVLWAPRIRSVS
jgi:predicted MFS family arabinose efflux permease